MLWRQYKAHYSTFAEHITIPDLRSTLQYHACGNNIKYTMLRLRRQHKAHNSALAEYITYNSTLVEKIQSTQFCACGCHIKHTIPRSIPRLRMPHKAYNSTLVETIQRILDDNLLLIDRVVHHVMSYEIAH